MSKHVGKHLRKMNQSMSKRIKEENSVTAGKGMGNQVRPRRSSKTKLRNTQEITLSKLQN